MPTRSQGVGVDVGQPDQVEHGWVGHQHGLAPKPRGTATGTAAAARDARRRAGVCASGEGRVRDGGTSTSTQRPVRGLGPQSGDWTSTASRGTVGTSSTGSCSSAARAGRPWRRRSRSHRPWRWRSRRPPTASAGARDRARQPPCPADRDVAQHVDRQRRRAARPGEHGRARRPRRPRRRGCALLFGSLAAAALAASSPTTADEQGDADRARGVGGRRRAVDARRAPPSPGSGAARARRHEGGERRHERPRWRGPRRAEPGDTTIGPTSRPAIRSMKGRTATTTEPRRVPASPTQAADEPAPRCPAGPASAESATTGHRWPTAGRWCASWRRGAGGEGGGDDHADGAEGDRAGDPPQASRLAAHGRRPCVRAVSTAAIDRQRGRQPARGGLDRHGRVVGEADPQRRRHGDPAAPGRRRGRASRAGDARGRRATGRCH